MRVLGIDPALSCTGYGIIDRRSDKGVKLIEAGVIRTNCKDSLDNRLFKFYRSLESVVKEFKPEVLILEKLYSHYKHPATSILMGHARGVVCLLCAQENINLVDVSATRIKKTITGNGHASKMQVKRMVEHTFGLGNSNYPSDVTDALALALGFLALKSREI